MPPGEPQLGGGGGGGVGGGGVGGGVGLGFGLGFGLGDGGGGELPPELEVEELDNGELGWLVELGVPADELLS